MITQYDGSGCPHRELAVGWALDALEPTEESLIAAHLPSCVECRRLVAETEQVGAMLGLSIPEEMPSPELEQRVLAVTADSPAAQVIPLTQPPQRTGIRRRRYRVLAAAASMILVVASVALGIRVVQLDGERDQAQRQLAAMSELIAQAADPATDLVPLVTSDGRGMGVVLAGPRNVTVMPTALPANRAEDQIYVLWGLPDGGSTSTTQAPRALVGFDVDPDAPRPHPVPSTGGAGKFAGYAVSLEPGRRLPASPTTVMASGQVNS